MTDINKQRLEQLKSDDVNDALLQEFFANTKSKKALFKVNESYLFTYKGKTINTTVGRYVFNKFVLEPDGLMDIIGYQNVALDGDVISDINNEIASLFLNGKINYLQYTDFLNREFWLAFKLPPFLNSSLDLNIVKPNKKVLAKKKELLKEYGKELEDGNLITAAKVEKELVKVAEDELKNDPSYSIYASKARGKFSNSYKNSSIMRGPIRSVADPSKFKISSDNLVEGTSKEDYPYFADINVAGSYGRAKNTQVGGYETKKLMQALQSIVLDDKDTDCHSHKYLEIVLTKKVANLFLNRYFVDSKDNLQLLTEDNLNNYIDKKMKFRSPLYCASKKICNKCAGETYYELGIKNIGLTLTTMSGSLTNKSMKSFHDTTLSTVKLDLFNYLK